jgi:hypothetical protein
MNQDPKVKKWIVNLMSPDSLDSNMEYLIADADPTIRKIGLERFKSLPPKLFGNFFESITKPLAGEASLDFQKVLLELAPSLSTASQKKIADYFITVVLSFGDPKVTKFALNALISLPHEVSTKYLKNAFNSSDVLIQKLIYTSIKDLIQYEALSTEFKNKLAIAEAPNVPNADEYQNCVLGGMR